MRKTEAPTFIDVRTSWVDHSPAFRAYAVRQVQSRLADIAAEIRSVVVRIADAAPGDLERRRCQIDVVTSHAGRITAAVVGVDPFALVDRALDSVLEQLRHRETVERFETWHQRIA